MKISFRLECGSLLALSLREGLPLFPKRPTPQLASPIKKFLCGALYCFIFASAPVSAQLVYCPTNSWTSEP
jgi:hypothetical protein